MHRIASLVAVIAIGLGACAGQQAETPVELAECHIGCFNDGCLERFLAAYAVDTVIVEVGTRDVPAVIDAVAFEIGLSQGTDG